MKITPLHIFHVESGANMAPFGGYDMPLWYTTGAKAEHLAVIKGAGLFDTSHMAVLTLQGPSARTLLQHCFSKDLDHCLGRDRAPLTDGRCVYGVFLNQGGGVIDDAIVYQLDKTSFMVVVNASMGESVTAHLRRQDGNREELEIIDHTDQVGKIDIQGPAAARILGKILTNPDTVFAGMSYFSFKGHFTGQANADHLVTLVDGTPLMVSRTGYTGEFGFELFVAPEHLAAIWNQLLAAGRENNILACGLAARDSLRAGAGLPLSHQDIGDWPFAGNPWLFALPWDNDAAHFTKSFYGSESLQLPAPPSYTLPFAGYDPRKIPVNEKSRVIDQQGQELGTLLTCTTDMAIDRVGDTIVSIATPETEGRPKEFSPRGLCCGFVKVDRPLQPGQVIVLTHGKRSLRVEIRDSIRPNRTARKAIKSML